MNLKTKIGLVSRPKRRDRDHIPAPHTFKLDQLLSLFCPCCPALLLLLRLHAHT